jgi:hypothetical protein
MIQIFSGSAELGRNRQNSDISLSDITKFDCSALQLQGLITNYVAYRAPL